MEMASDNQITIVGNLTDDPELRYTPNGAAVVNFSVAVTPRIRDEGGGWKDGDTSFFRVNAWRTLAENSAESLTRGSRVVVVGRLRQRSWETPEGERRSVVEIEADELGPSLRWATAKIERQGRRRLVGQGSRPGRRRPEFGRGDATGCPLRQRSDRRGRKRKRRPGRRSRSGRSASSARTGSSTSTTRTSWCCASSSPSGARSVP